MKKLRFLLLDANVVIQLFELNLWAVVVEKCEIMLSRIVIDQEARFFRKQPDGSEQPIDLSEDIAAGRIQPFDVTPTQVGIFVGQFTDEYLAKLDPGETESLCYISICTDPCVVCSADAIVFRVLGCLNRSELGISLEEVLNQIGRSARLPYQYSKDYRIQFTKQGQMEQIQGRALKSD